MLLKEKLANDLVNSHKKVFKSGLRANWNDADCMKYAGFKAGWDACLQHLAEQAYQWDDAHVVDLEDVINAKTLEA